MSQHRRSHSRGVVSHHTQPLAHALPARIDGSFQARNGNECHTFQLLLFLHTQRKSLCIISQQIPMIKPRCGTAKNNDGHSTDETQSNKNLPSPGRRLFTVFVFRISNNIFLIWESSIFKISKCLTLTFPLGNFDSDISISPKLLNCNLRCLRRRETSRFSSSSPSSFLATNRVYTEIQRFMDTK